MGTRSTNWQAAGVVLLAALGETLSTILLRDTASLTRTMLAAVSGSFLMWWIAAGMWHGVSRLFKKSGEFCPFLRMTGWCFAIYWLLAPISLVFAEWSGLSRWTLAAAALLEIAALGLAWESIKINYGWKGSQALLVLFGPPLVLAGFAFALAAFLTISLVSGVLIAKLLF